LGVVVERVAGVPAEDHVAEAQGALGRAPELVQREVLAAQDAVDVERAQLHLADLPARELSAQRLDLIGARLADQLFVVHCPSPLALALPLPLSLSTAGRPRARPWARPRIWISLGPQSSPRQPERGSRLRRASLRGRRRRRARRPAARA